MILNFTEKGKEDELDFTHFKVELEYIWNSLIKPYYIKIFIAYIEFLQKNKLQCFDNF